MINQIKTYIIYFLSALVVAMGLWMYITKPIAPEKPLTLKPDEITKTVISGTKIQTLNKISSNEASYVSKDISPRDKDIKIIVKDNGSVVVENHDLVFLPLNISIGLQYPQEPTPVIEISLLRYKQYSLHAGVSQLGLSLSANRDLYDIFSFAPNTYIGIFIRKNYNASTNYGLQGGIYF